MTRAGGTERGCRTHPLMRLLLSSPERAHLHHSFTFPIQFVPDFIFLMTESWYVINLMGSRNSSSM